jgi:hypothetical protein
MATLRGSGRLAPPSRLPTTATPPGEVAHPNLAPSARADEEVNPYLPAEETAKSSNVVETCLLNLHAIPAAKVVVDGMPLGFTSQKSVAVPVGEHRVRFFWTDGERSEVISCTRGQTKTVAVRLSDQPPSEELPEKNPYR